MAQTIRLLSTYKGNPPNTIITVDDSVATALLANGIGATTVLTGGVYRLDQDIAAALGNQDLSAHPYRPGPQTIEGLAGNIKLPPAYPVSGTDIRNFAHAFSAWDEFTAVRCVFANHQATDAVVDGHRVATTSTAWPGGTFNINAPESGWSTLAPALTIPGGTGKKPGLALGPEFPTTPIARALGELDGGKYPLLLVRTLRAAGNATMPMVDLGTGFPDKYDPVNFGFSMLTAPRSNGVDYVTSNPEGWNTSGARETLPSWTVFGAIFTYTKQTTNFMFVGDSIMGGFADAASERAPWGFRAMARIRETKRVAYFNGGISGSKMSEITARAKEQLLLVNPAVVVMSPYSTNAETSDPLSAQGAWDRQWYQVMDLVQAVQAAGKIAVLTTPLPFTGISAAQNAMRLKQLRRVVESGLPYINFESLADATGNWANPVGSTVPDTTDGTHMSQAGHHKASLLAEPVLHALVR